MNTYHKINTIFKRDTNHKIIIGEYSCDEFRYLANNVWQWSEKVDGTNIRVMWNGEQVSFNGKTDNAQVPMNLIQELNKMFEGTAKKVLFKEKFGIEACEVCLYGEGYGVKIQSGGNYIKDGVSFVLFDVLINNIWLQREDVEDVAKYFNIKVAPIIGEGTLADALEKVKLGFNSQWGDFTAEGIVARPKTELKARNGERIITKIKHRDFKN